MNIFLTEIVKLFFPFQGSFLKGAQMIYKSLMNHLINLMI